MMVRFWALCLLSAAPTLAFVAPRGNNFFHNDVALRMAAEKTLVVISPPGGVGEVTAVKAATMGSAVRWFVVSQTGNPNVVLSQSALDEIASAGGSVELAGADAESLLLPEEDPKSAVAAVSTWCGQANGMACTFDGIQAAKAMENSKEDPTQVWKNAIKLAAKQVAPAVSGAKVAILSALDQDIETEQPQEEKGGLGSLVGSLVGGGGVSLPATLTQAMAADASKLAILRHGELFGTPESSPDFSPLVGGPQRNPEFCEEYMTRSVRIDPTLTVTGNVMMGKNTRSSRHSVGEAAARILLDKVSATGLDLCLSSQMGSDLVGEETWQEEFQRSAKMLESGAGAQLFSASFSSVPDTERLADWLATKWAPAVLRTYDIAAIRTGARPVIAKRAGDGKVEIVWQELVDFNSVTVGKMIVEVSGSGLVATRGPGDAAAGFGAISSKPLNGENVLVMRLAEAASQAIDKGLAKKVAKKQAPKKEPVKEPVAAAPVATTIAASGTVDTPPAAPRTDSGPRQAGARRSKERARGSKRRKPSASKKEDS
ncbi:expressed unknown protein [Seminavis robusta]|uniref:Uncharacterized protein n=1 Tax=Seminavis robusta TaxID=568900 RepID=A0A9N8EL97_9STRA|nr:expressed unknown protein [Seminavis robusta]|eukprot:Sro1338_g264240.1 n/a (543) ;mRNA; r:20565-22334